LRKRDGGFSLLEALVAAAILGSALAGLLLVHYESIQRWTEARYLKVATELAETLVAEAEVATDLRPGHREGRFADYPEYAWTRDVVPATVLATTDLWRVKVSVTYPGQEVRRTYELSTLLFRPPEPEAEPEKEKDIPQEKTDEQGIHPD